MNDLFTSSDTDLQTEPSGAVDTGVTVPVVVPVMLDAAFDYSVPANLEIPPGSFVAVPFGRQQRIGVVWDRRDKDAAPVNPAKLKTVIDVYPLPPLTPTALRFAEWIAQYTLAPRGMALRLMMGAGDIFEPEKVRTGVMLAHAPEQTMSAARERVIAAAADGQVRTRADLARAASVSAGVVSALVGSGVLVEAAIGPQTFAKPRHDHWQPDFQGQQVDAVEQLRAIVSQPGFSATLLDGVTGSGKTEVYFEAVAAVLEAGRQVLVLLPEIALTGQFLDRFTRRFGVAPVEWHSALSGPQRARVWRAAASGDARVIVGARSALFLPFCDLGLIVVDEEHDSSFKQEDRVCYQGRDMAIVRASLGSVPAVLASATPAIETQVNARSGKYNWIQLTERFSDAALPEITAIDMRSEGPERGRWLSPGLVEAVTQTVTRGEQALLFLNRRGYAPLTLCRACGHRYMCPQCDAWLVEHRFRKRLTCHHCGFQTPTPERCMTCGESDSLTACGPGVERVCEEVAEVFPNARTAVLSSDLIPGITEMRAVLDSILAGDIDIIVGTQIVAKGHHFPALTTVGIVDGDLGLSQGDLRASERSFQLLQQVMGRAGREEKPGRGLIQTHMPEHPVMQALLSGDRETFVAAEIADRETAMMPPFGRLAALVVSARDRGAAETTARDLASCAPTAAELAGPDQHGGERFAGIDVLGPVEAPIAVVRNRHRFRLLVRAPRSGDLQGYIRAWMSRLGRTPSDVRIHIDIDPYSFL